MKRAAAVVILALVAVLPVAEMSIAQRPMRPPRPGPPLLTPEERERHTKEVERLNEVRRDYPDGTVVKGPDSDEQYLVFEARRRHIPDVATKIHLNFRHRFGPMEGVDPRKGYKEISNEELNRIPVLPELPHLDSSLVIGEGRNEQYFIVDGMKRHVADEKTLVHIGVAHILLTRLSLDALGRIPTAHPGYPPLWTNLFRVLGGETYLMERGLRRHVPDPLTFETMNLRNHPLQPIDSADMINIPEGPPWPRRSPPAPPSTPTVETALGAPLAECPNRPFLAGQNWAPMGAHCQGRTVGHIVCQCSTSRSLGVNCRVYEDAKGNFCRGEQQVSCAYRCNP